MRKLGVPLFCPNFIGNDSRVTPSLWIFLQIKVSYMGKTKKGWAPIFMKSVPRSLGPAALPPCFEGSVLPSAALATFLDCSEGVKWAPNGRRKARKKPGRTSSKHRTRKEWRSWASSREREILEETRRSSCRDEMNLEKVEMNRAHQMWRNE